MKSRGELKTEKQNNQSLNIDTVSVREILLTINKEDQKVSQAVEAAIPKIENVVHLCSNSIKKGGRIFYIGAGTSGRLGVLDASEIPPTYSAPENWFIGIIAGGDGALRNSIEGAEDKPENAVTDLEPYGINNKDVLIGISCSGAASYVISALQYSRKLGAKTVYLVTNPKPFNITKVDEVVVVDTGPEIVTGSTRMKAGTATKMVLNMITTVSMVKLNKTYGNLMVDLKASNEKLKDSATKIIMHLNDLEYEDAIKLLKSADDEVKTAVLMKKMHIDKSQSRQILKNNQGSLRDSLKGV